MFGARIARHEAKRFRRKGLPSRSRKLLAAVENAIPLDGATSIEVGAGVGGLTITMLKRGLQRAHIVDAVPAYVSVARQLASEFDVDESLDLEIGDFVVRAPELPTFDIVMMDRVVCCYPVWMDLLDAAAGHAGTVVALSYPRTAWWSKAGIAVINFVNRVRRLAFRVYVHPPARMHGLLTERGFQPRVVGYDGPWEIMVATRVSG
jgi:magnesium-protoporphyrin O-methyltransferase